ncbi:MAG: DsbA family protein [Alphaproteobacteria bacterium]|nr:DsbA family protein [Alphaproteobacteria bacterium]
MRLYPILIGALAIGLIPAVASAESVKPLADAERAQVEDVVREFLTKKEPEVVMKAVQEMQRRQEEETASRSKQAMVTSHDKIFNDATSPTVGNLKGDVTMVEFFDYQCGHCKKVNEAIVKLIAEEKNVRVVYKEFPILGAGSVFASKAALASVRQGKYEKFHDALLNSKEHLSDEIIKQVAKDVGLNVEKLQKDMNDPEIEKIIQSNLALGNEIGVRGTPMFIVGDKMFPGAMQLPQMKQAVEEARKSAKK